MFEIKDFEVVKREVYKYIEVEVLELKLNEKATLRVCAYPELKSLPKVDIVDLEGDDYANWGNDDEYLYRKVCEKLGYCPAKEEVFVDASGNLVDASGVVLGEELGTNGDFK